MDFGISPRASKPDTCPLAGSNIGMLHSCEGEELQKTPSKEEEKDSRISSPKRVTQDQLSKLQELHKRRLQIKSKIHKKSKDGTGKSHGKDLKSKDTGTGTEDSGVLDLKTLGDNANISTPQGNASAHHSEKKRQKLHWGLDTKERWERKANM
ncbi:PROTEIN FAM204A [Salix purpurea]|uniref:PROTEIN FAM204A n=1 Tax=Salix purpurea TaxID=77065 RepID=A0A9Q0ZHY7_SALPP|nr:PROTEIN FAM204A [Salix purpurea]